MTEQEKEELSKAVADKYGIDSITYLPFSYMSTNEEHKVMILDYKDIWLHDDSARCFDLMVEYRIEVANTENIAVAYYYYNNCVNSAICPFDEYPTKQEATRIAILKALLAKD